MKTAQELRAMLNYVETAMGATMLIRELAEDLIARREAEEAKANGAAAEAHRARVLSECRQDTWSDETGGATTLTHKPTGRFAAAPARDAALDILIEQIPPH